MMHEVTHPDQLPPAADYPYTERAKAARSGEHVSRWVLVGAIIAAAAIFWTLAADAFTSV